MNIAYIISIIIIMLMTCMISVIIIIFTICINRVIAILETLALPSTRRAEFLRASSPWSAWPSRHRRRVDAPKSPHRGPSGHVGDCAEAVRCQAACLSKSRNSLRNVTTVHRTVVDTKPP